MNTNFLKVGLAIVAAVILILVLSATFVVDQRQQALVLRFGGIRQVVLDAGLYFKLPFIENVVYVDKRVLDLDLPAQEVIASDQKRLVVDTFTRYRVDDPLRFYQTVGNVVGANQRLTQIVNSVTRATLAEATFASIVKDDRPDLMKSIRDEVNAQTKGPPVAKANQQQDREQRGLGIEVIDVRLRRVDLPDQNSEAVYRRMKTEREAEAADLRAQGQQEALRIKANADREVTVIVANANRDSEKLRGTGDAERNEIFNEAYGKNEDFFAFYRSMQAYEVGLKATDTRLVLSPDSAFFRYFTDPNAKAHNHSAPAGTGGGAGAQGSGPATGATPRQ